MRRRDFVGHVARTAAVGVGGFLGSSLSTAEGQVSEPEGAQVGDIYQLQAAFHRAKTTQDIDFWKMTAGRAFPLSVDQYYFP